MTSDLPQHARERLEDMRKKTLFTSDLSVSEFLLVKEAGFDPVGLVMGTSIYQIKPTIPRLQGREPGRELTETTKALYHARELAMNRMEEEAEALGADGIVGVRLTIKLGTNPVRNEWSLYQSWQEWARGVGFPRKATLLGNDWESWRDVAQAMWTHYASNLGWSMVPTPPWAMPQPQTSYGFGQNAAEFLAIGTAVKHRGRESFKNVHGKPFQSDLNGQDFWTLIETGYRPVGFVMGNCVYYVPPALLSTAPATSTELHEYTHALYDARELAIERLQDEAEALGATGIVGVTVAEREHSWRTEPWNAGNVALSSGEVIELFVVGTAVVPMEGAPPLDKPELRIVANDRESAK
ncbi:MAG TPA: heavy metal-binding domain-containing protein [Polyangiaceae bacterium]|jgi:uncharacterized protein YbjQ (UPF0145 family)